MEPTCLKGWRFAVCLPTELQKKRKKLNPIPLVLCRIIHCHRYCTYLQKIQCKSYIYIYHLMFLHICDSTTCCMTCKVQKHPKTIRKGIRRELNVFASILQTLKKKIPKIRRIYGIWTGPQNPFHLELSVPEARRFTSIGSPAQRFQTRWSLCWWWKFVKPLCVESRDYTKKRTKSWNCLRISYIYIYTHRVSIKRKNKKNSTWSNFWN